MACTCCSISSDKVFDGSTAHVPAEAPTAPVSEYGRQKARTEAALRTYTLRGAPVPILRLAKVVSPARGLVRDWTAALKARTPIRAFHDRTMAPVAAATVVRAIAALTGERARRFPAPRPARRVLSRCRLVSRRALDVDKSLVLRTSLAETNPPKGAAPPHTTLDSRALAEHCGIVVLDAFQVLASVVGDPSALRVAPRDAIKA